MRRVSKWVVNRIRWHRFDIDLQKWLQGRHDTPPPEMATEDLDGVLRARAATFLKNAWFDASETDKLLSVAVAFAKGRLMDAEFRDVRPTDS